MKYNQFNLKIPRFNKFKEIFNKKGFFVVLLKLIFEIFLKQF
jgi:hypothetical protein